MACALFKASFCSHQTKLQHRNGQKPAGKLPCSTRLNRRLRDSKYLTCKAYESLIEYLKKKLQTKGKPISIAILKLFDL